MKLNHLAWLTAVAVAKCVHDRLFQTQANRELREIRVAMLNQSRCDTLLHLL
jgi:hypothetical protein